MPSRTAGIAGVIGLGAALFALPAATQPRQASPCSGDVAACGKREFEQGVAAYQAGDFAVATLHFKQALAYRAHPVVAFNLALAQGKSGQLLEAIQTLDGVLLDPQSSAKLKTNAARERDGFIAGLGVVELDSAVAGRVEATVDGQALSGSPPAMKVNPGPHRVQIRADGRTIVDRTINVGLAERVRLSITREREVTVVLPDKNTPVPGPTPPPAGGLDPAWFYGGVGMTAVLSGLTVWSALDTRASFNDYKAALPTLTQDQINQQVDAGHGKERRTNVLLGTTVLAAAGTAAVGLFAVRWGDKQVGPAVGLSPSGVLIRGSF